MINERVNRVKFWCQKVLPLVFDDSLSYYETLCKFSKKLNELIDLTNQAIEEINKFEQYVDKELTDMRDILQQFHDDLIQFQSELREEIKELSDNIDRQFDELNRKTEERIANLITEVNDTISQLRDEIHTSLTTTIEQVNNVITNFRDEWADMKKEFEHTFDSKISEIDEKMAEMDKEFDEKMSDVDKRLDDLEQTLDDLTGDGLRQRIDEIVRQSLASMIFVEIVDGHFTYYIPDTWDNISFYTAGYDYHVDGLEYGTLLLKY